MEIVVGIAVAIGFFCMCLSVWCGTFNKPLPKLCQKAGEKLSRAIRWIIRIAVALW